MTLTCQLPAFGGRGHDRDQSNLQIVQFQHGVFLSGIFINYLQTVRETDEMLRAAFDKIVPKVNRATESASADLPAAGAGAVKLRLVR